MRRGVTSDLQLEQTYNASRRGIRKEGRMVAVWVVLESSNYTATFARRNKSED